MERATAATASRRVLLARLLSAVAAVSAVGAALAGGAGATKKGRNTISSVVRDRVKYMQGICEDLGGGTLDVRPSYSTGTVFTYCEGGRRDGTNCTHTEQGTSCQCSHTGKDGVCDRAKTAPPQSGVAAPPTGSANENPTNGNEAGGAAAPPGGDADPDGGERKQRKKRTARKRAR